MTNFFEEESARHMAEYTRGLTSDQMRLGDMLADLMISGQVGKKTRSDLL